jgi:hypothetical protein
MGVSVRTSRVVSCLDVVLCTCPESKRSDLGVLLRVYHAFRGLLANLVVFHISDPRTSVFVYIGAQCHHRAREVLPGMR